MDQAQKVFRLERGDCCLAFCGDAQVAHPLFITVGSTLNNFIKTRSRAEDVTQVRYLIEQILANAVASWDLGSAEKSQELQGTCILFAGWSWINRRFDIGYFNYVDNRFQFQHEKLRLSHPWHERTRSLVLIGDYKSEYLAQLYSVLEHHHGKPDHRETKIRVDLSYEPLEALHALLEKPDPEFQRTSIGGAVQLVKVYSYGNSLPFVIRKGINEHFLLGRKLFQWEKTEYPVLDLTKDIPEVIYPMSEIPVPANLRQVPAADNNEVIQQANLPEH